MTCQSDNQGSILNLAFVLLLVVIIGTVATGHCQELPDAPQPQITDYTVHNGAVTFAAPKSNTRHPLRLLGLVAVNTYAVLGDLKPNSIDVETNKWGYVPSLDNLSEPRPRYLATKPEMPKMATGRDYLDNSASLNGLNQLYKAAGPSLFMVPQGAQQQPEKLVPIAQDGSFGQTSTGGGRDGKGAMHATATIPSDSQAIIHTHPAGQNPQPSADDYATATKTGKPNFVMSGSAIYVAMPGGSTKNPVKVADIKPGKGGKLAINWTN